MLARGEVHLNREWVGRRIRFADGTTACVFRETVAGPRPADPCILLVSFRLLAVRGVGHTLFERESLLNTPLFVGFPGFASKLWIAHDDRDTYRGLYEWDGAARAEYYARALWRILELVSVPRSIAYRVLPGLRREDVLGSTTGGASVTAQDDAWWRAVAVA